MRSDREKKLLREIKRAHTSKYVATLLRGIPDTSEKIDALAVARKTLALEAEKVLKRNQEAAASRILIANLQKALDNARRDLGRDAKLQENQALVKALKDLEQRYNTLSTEYRTLQKDSQDAITGERENRYRIQELQRQLTRSADEAKAIASREFAEQVETWQKRALECGWQDPNTKTEQEKLRELRRAELAVEHPEMSSSDIDQMLDTRERFLGLEL